MSEVHGLEEVFKVSTPIVVKIAIGKGSVVSDDIILFRYVPT